MENEPTARDGAAREPGKKQRYDRPVLVIYGDIREVTRAAAPSGSKNDGGSGKDKSAAGAAAARRGQR